MRAGEGKMKVLTRKKQEEALQKLTECYAALSSNMIQKEDVVLYHIRKMLLDTIDLVGGTRGRDRFLELFIENCMVGENCLKMLRNPKTGQTYYKGDWSRGDSKNAPMNSEDLEETIYATEYRGRQKYYTKGDFLELCQGDFASAKMLLKRLEGEMPENFFSVNGQ